MTELENLKQQLRQLQKMASLGTLTAGIAHEIQNPLNFVINFSKMSERLLHDLLEVVDGVADRIEKQDAEELEEITADLRQNLQHIQEHGERAISIIRSILLQSRGKENEFIPTDIARMTHEYVWLSYHAMRAGDSSFNVSIQEDYEEGMAQYMVIPQDLSRAVLNVMNNACYTVHERAQQQPADYTPTIRISVSTDTVPEGTLTADGKPAKALLVMSISDNGMGMSEEIQHKLFTTFFTTKPIGKGTGLGMTITHEIVVEKHAGEVSFTSVPSEGSTFTFRIPVR